MEAPFRQVRSLWPPWFFVTTFTEFRRALAAEQRYAQLARINGATPFDRRLTRGEISRVVFEEFYSAARGRGLGNYGVPGGEVASKILADHAEQGDQSQVHRTIEVRLGSHLPFTVALSCLKGHRERTLVGGLLNARGVVQR